MAGKKPSFVTGANAKIKAGGLTIAYAQDVNYSTTVTTIPIEVMGRYEVVSNEPVAYFVEGTLSVIRYTKIAAQNGMDKVDANGNSVANWNFANGGGDGFQHINPAELLASQTWDMEVFQKFDAGGSTDSEMVAKLRDCRFTRKAGGLNKRGVLTEQFGFNAILADDGEDATHQAANSGDQDLQA